MKKNKNSEKISKRVAANGKRVVAYVAIALIVMFILIFAGAAYLFVRCISHSANTARESAGGGAAGNLS